MSERCCSAAVLPPLAPPAIYLLPRGPELWGRGEVGVAPFLWPSLLRHLVLCILTSCELMCEPWSVTETGFSERSEICPKLPTVLQIQRAVW